MNVLKKIWEWARANAISLGVGFAIAALVVLWYLSGRRSEGLAKRILKLQGGAELQIQKGREDLAKKLAHLDKAYVKNREKAIERAVKRKNTIRMMARESTSEDLREEVLKGIDDDV